ncbi:MAG: hypothetical protein AB7G87_01230 [Clostridia bacterium]
MDVDEKKVTQYLVPANVSARFEFFVGFGWRELFIVLIALAAGMVLFFGLGIFKEIIYVDVWGKAVEVTEGMSLENLTEKKVSIIPTVIRFFFIIIPGLAAFFLVKREPSSGMSLLDTVKSLRDFNKKQKRYLYKYGSGQEG